ncbi:hypothetical protein CO173_03005 [Candidatus Uhrbacteria bacterium CG_4_9_14_3_um_filter_41_35]|uniref:AcrB/AcrD/AcrF family protein n=1 Tax=Candidatus Uhrbacteria bacterium CG_4_9_14_3_um_filter_41_35 TaxID=1975034 RepID=A0A2M7XFN9_9BACT|nr:MAG: hypothetical protein COV92_03975 [Candidatus Uhrbacteria bacterium CG11_big_fil_rev_8_21_14_0_20_41_9]PJA46710.1 MAG: hypothetical protein CO173_03005 [Candidatus Uhrbacteria bacterium CG_4_9_14_3_um_filter_41_35]
MWNFLVIHQKFTIIIILALTIAGLVSVNQLPKESAPEVNIPFIIVSTPFPGANALDVESFVTNKIEDNVSSIEGLKNLTSTSALGMSSVALEFNVGVDIDKKLTEVKDATDIAKLEFPSDAKDPLVANVNFNDTPIKTYALAGPYSRGELQLFAEELKSKLDQLPNVDSISLSGGDSEQVQILIEQRRLDQFELSLNQVVRAIQSANSNIPIGSIESSNSDISVRFDGTINTINDLKRIPLSLKNGAPIFVSDVAEVIYGTEDKTSSSYLSTDNKVSNPAISISIVKSPGGDILKLVKKADEIIYSSIGTTLPEDLQVEVIDDSAEQIKADLGNLSMSGLETTLIVTLLIFFTLGWREAILTSLSIPLTFLITFLTLDLFGYTLNFLTLFALILALGILVDGVIVITEGLHSNINKGLPPTKAALATIAEFEKPLIAGTLTTIFAFVPMLLTSGMIGQFIKSIPVTVSIVLFSSLFIALGVIPTLGTSLLGLKTKPGKFKTLTDKLESFRENSIFYLQNIYSGIIDKFLYSKPARKSLAIILTFAFVGSLALPALGILKVDMFPSSDTERVYIDFSLPQGTALFATEKTMTEVEKYLHNKSEIKSYLISSGAGSSLGGGTGSNIGSVNINLTEERRDSRKITAEIEREITSLVPEATISVAQLSSGPPSGAPVEISIAGQDLQTLEQIAEEFKKIITEIPGTKSVTTSVVNTSGEFVYTINRAVVARYGLSPTEVATTMRTALFGSTVATLSLNGNDIDVVATYKLSENDTKRNAIEIAKLSSITMQTQFGDIPISTFLDTNLKPSQASIPHKDGERIVTVTADVELGVVAQDVFTEVKKEMVKIDIPGKYTVKLGGQNDDITQSFTDMAKAMVLGIFMIAGLLVLQFNSYKQPLIVLSSIPLALIGVLPGLVIVNQTLSFPGVIGVVALAGIVVNNGIILIDRINENRLAGMEILIAVKESTMSRLRPILLTTITTVAGLVPLVISQPEWASLGYAIIFGLIFSTVSTLIVVPLLYAGIEKHRK